MGSCAGKSGGAGQFNEEDLPILKRVEVAKHNTPEDCWVVLDGIVYDLSQYWKVHPGGGDYIKKWAGKDCTLAFREFNHSAFAEIQLKTLGAEKGRIDEVGDKFEPTFYQETPIKSKANDVEDLFAETGDMFCYQCQQTVNGSGCTDMGVCGKSPAIAALQDLIVHYQKGLCQYVVKVDDKHFDDVLYYDFLYGFFMTLTNVNFNEDKHFEYLDRLATLRDKFRAIYEKDTPADKRDPFLSNPNSPSTFVFKKGDKKYLFLEAKKVGINARKKVLNPDLLGLLEMCVYGMKGGAAYMYHAEGIRRYTEGVYDENQRKAVFKQLFQVTASMADPNPSLEFLIGLNMDVGKANFSVMDMLDKGHNVAFGVPVPSPVNRAPVEGKCILVSGHDLMVLKKLLIQTEGKGVNVYTHGEMLPAFGYPELKKFKHLVGNFGTAWFNQTNEFPDFPGAILLNSNCLIQPQPSYAKRLFTTHIVGWDDIKHIEGENYTELIDCALKCPGFKQGTRQFKKYQTVESEETGWGHATMAEKLVPEILAGNLTEIYLVGGCDNLDPTRQKYLETILDLPKTAIVLTLGCAKFRLFGHKKEMGFLPGEGKIPRLIDVGQCNDAYSAVKVALALTEVLKVGVNELPLHLVLSWVEQKAVVILLTLLHLGIQNINIGPNLPAYATPNVLKYLIDTFNLNVMGTPKQVRALKAFNETPKVVEQKEVSVFDKVGTYEMCNLLEQKQIAQNIYRAKYGFQNPNAIFSLCPGQHVLFRTKVDDQVGNYVTRAYTPITPVGTKGYFEIIYKVYPSGLFSNFLNGMKVGQGIEVQGPCGTTIFQKNLLKSEKRDFQNVQNINMITGGTSNVSMFQLVQDIVLNKKTDINVSVIVANSNEKMEVLKQEFMDLVKRNTGQNKIHIKYITSNKDGRISKELFQKELLQDSKAVQLVAGPHNFRNTAKAILQEMGVVQEQIVQFY